MYNDTSRVSCQKGPTHHAYAQRIGPFLAGYHRPVISATRVASSQLKAAFIQWWYCAGQCCVALPCLVYISNHHISYHAFECYNKSIALYEMYLQYFFLAIRAVLIVPFRYLLIWGYVVVWCIQYVNTQRGITQRQQSKHKQFLSIISELNQTNWWVSSVHIYDIILCSIFKNIWSLLNQFN